MKPNPNDYCIVPKVATDEMFSEMGGYTDFIFSDQITDTYDYKEEMKLAWNAAISAAPPHNLVAVEKSLIREVIDTIDAIRSEPAHLPYSKAHLSIIEKLKALNQ